MLTECSAEGFVKQISGEKDAEAALQRLDRLSPNEAQTTTVEILRVVYGLICYMSE